MGIVGKENQVERSPGLAQAPNITTVQLLVLNATIEVSESLCYNCRAAAKLAASTKDAEIGPTTDYRLHSYDSIDVEDDVNANVV